MNGHSNTRHLPRLHPLALAASLLAGAVGDAAWALPQGAQRVSGQVTIERPGAGAMLIQQRSASGIVNWQGFSIGKGESVRVQQPGAGSVLLNRVVGADPSRIFGQLSANGKVFLLNPNGVLFGPSSRVDVGSLLASTLSLNDSDFLAGRYRFAAGSGNAAAVVNNGHIETSDRGTVALLGGTVRNDGRIEARLGTVALAAGSRITLDLAGDGLSRIAVTQAAMDAQVANGGVIVADGGAVLLRADALNALVGDAVNQSGVVRARSLVERNGRIVLDGGDGGTTMVSGVLEATGSSGTRGGEIQVLGHHVGVTGAALLDASGAASGGMVLVGGDYQGKNPEVRNAADAFVGADATLRADATANGHGGKVIVWGNEATRAHGVLSARGGPLGGDGGLVETSGKFLDTTGARVVAAAPAGRAGQWLLDPADIVIGAGPTTAPPGYAPDFTSAQQSSLVAAAQVQNSLNEGTSVTLSAGNPAGSMGFGDIVLSAGTKVLKSEGATPVTLRLNAIGSIVMNEDSSIASSSGPLSVDFNSYSLGIPAQIGGLTVTGGAIVMSQGASISSNGGDVRFFGANDPVRGAARGVSFPVGVSAVVALPGRENGIRLDRASISTCPVVGAGCANGGSISLQGSGTATVISLGPGSQVAGGSGVRSEGAVLETGSGALTVAGVGGSGGRGVDLTGAATGNAGAPGPVRTVIRSQSGPVTIDGTGGALAANTLSVGDPLGVVIEQTSASAPGAGIRILGTGADASFTVATVTANPPFGTTVRTPTHGVLMSDGVQLSAGSGGIVIDGKGGSDGITTVVGATVVRVPTKVFGIASLSSTVTSPGGPITLRGNTAGVSMGGDVYDLSSTAAGAIGGRFAASGGNVGVINTKISADGPSGGGSVQIDADNVAFVAANSVLSANATQSGNGGQVRVRALTTYNPGNGGGVPESASTARVFGRLEARGGPLGGQGGVVETSGLALDVRGIGVDVAAPAGTAGTWLIDPVDVVISSGATAGGSLPDYLAAAPGASIQNTDINKALNGGLNVTISTGASTSVQQPGDIYVSPDAPITKSAGAEATLRLNAHGRIRIEGDIVSTVGSLNLDLNSDSDSSGSGEIGIASFDTARTLRLFTNGGSVRVFGQNDPLSGRAVGYNPEDPVPGMLLYHTIIDTRVGSSAAAPSGNIVLRGSGGALGSAGVELQGSSLLASTGVIEINGIGAPGNDGVQLSGNDRSGSGPLAPTIVAGGSGGVRVFGAGGGGLDANATPLINRGVWIAGSQVSAAGGALDIRGRASSSASTGVLLSADLGTGGATLLSSVGATGPGSSATLSGESVGSGLGVNLEAGATLGSPGADGPIVIRALNDGSAKSLRLAGPVIGSGVLNLRPGGVAASPSSRLPKPWQRPSRSTAVAPVST